MKRMLEHLESTVEEQKRPVLALGIAVTPCMHTNFKTRGGDNPLEDAILRMCRDVITETVDKIMEVSAMLCERVDVEFEVIPQELMLDMVKRAINGEGKLTTGEELDVKLSGKRTDH